MISASVVKPLIEIPNTSVYIIGLGVVGVSQITPEARDTLRKCRCAFVVDHGFGVLEHLRTLTSEVIDLLPEYREGLHRLTTYQRMAGRVVDAAMRRAPVAFATYGHPYWLVYPTALIKSACQELGIGVEIIGGISSIDAILLDLDLDPGTQGLQIFEATSLVTEQRRPNPDVPCLLMQVDAFDTPEFTMQARSASRYERLRDYLIGIYPGDHRVRSVYSRTHPLLNSLSWEFELHELPTAFTQEIISGTLYIPPVCYT